MNQRKTMFRVSTLLTLVAAAALLIAACTPTPAPPTRTGVPPTQVVELVTLTPTLTPSLTLTPTLPYEINNFLGRWQILVNYTLQDGPVFSNIRYSGSAELQVDILGNISGTIAFYGTASQLPCNALVLDPGPLTAKISGALRSEDGAVLADLTIQPDNMDQPSSLKLTCIDMEGAILVNRPLLWPALRLTDVLNTSVSFELGRVQSSAHDLTGPSGGLLRGTLVTEYRISR